jgi:N-acetylmuramoyl-L-alanine amidase
MNRARPVVTLAVLSCALSAQAQKVYLNPSDQTANSVAGGGVESDYALINANLARDILVGAGFDVRVDQSFTNAPSNANSWDADIFISIHSNASGGHGTESLYKTTGGQALAQKVNDGLVGLLPYYNRGLKLRTDLHVLNNTTMYATLTEVVFHDCTTTVDTCTRCDGHPPSESAFLRSAAGQQDIAQGIANGVCAYYSRSCSTQPPAKGFLKGVVYQNGDLQNHVAGATVRLNTGPSQVYNGTQVWSFELDPGEYTVTASMTGYTSNSVTRTVSAGVTAWGSVEIFPTAAPDAGQPRPDAGQPRPDAGQPRPDAGPPVPPPTPAPVSPVGGTVVNGDNVTLSWTRVTDTQGGMITYNLEVYQGFVVSGSPMLTMGAPQVVAQVVSAVLPLELDPGPFTWRVQAQGPGGTSGWSAGAQFTVAGEVGTSSSAAPPSSLEASSSAPPSSTESPPSSSSSAVSSRPPSSTGTGAAPNDDKDEGAFVGGCANVAVEVGAKVPLLGLALVALALLRRVRRR